MPENEMKEMIRQFLAKLYELTDGDVEESVPRNFCEKELGYEHDLCGRILRYLGDSGLIDWDMELNLRLTYMGKNEVESLMD